MKYEYDEIEASISVLNKYGLDGWRLCYETTIKGYRRFIIERVKNK
jgi:hypothetical protein